MSEFSDGKCNGTHKVPSKKNELAYVSAILTIVSSVLLWAMTVETRVTGNTVNIEAVSSQVDRVEARSASDMKNVTEAMMRIDDKLDRLIERK